MRFLETLSFFFLLLSLTEAQQAQGNCDITSITSPSASNLYIKWTSFPGATNYALDLRVVNNPAISPVTLDLTATTTERLVQGLRPGSQYQVTFKVYQFYYVLCISYKLALTVPAASQLTFARAASSTSASFQWTNVSGADSYVLMVEGTFHSEHRNLTFSVLSGDMPGLQPASTYSCYVYSSNAAGLGTKSNVKTINTLVPPPASVTVAMVSNSAVRVTWPSVSGVVLYQVSLVENNRIGVAPLAWNTSALALNIPNLKPCTNYTVRVSSMNMFLQPGEPVTASYASSPITSVTSISADYSCSNAMATISWDSVPGATSYRAVATARDGTTLSCQTAGTSCQISALGCGEQYTVRIASVAECESVSNISYTFETAPCPPKNPEVYHECLSNVVIFSWNATNNTAYYIAMSVDADGVTSECLTLYNSCYFTQTECGRSYNFTVTSVYAGTDSCSSGSTAPVTISTAPCLPQSVTTSAMDCLSDTLITRWDPAPGALRYFVEAHGNHDDSYNCTSNGTSCAMTNVKCGQSLSVWITAYNNRCATDIMLAEVAETVPCVPQQVSVSDTCGSFSVTLSWMTSNNAFLYTAKAVLPDSSIRSCYTKDTWCEIKDLQCGQTYEVFVMSTNFICNSSDSQHFYAQTAPCAPVSVQAQMDCQLNTATVHWLGQQAGGSYTALLADGDGGVLNCSTSSNNCSVPNLRCGQTYNITVLQNLTQCNSLPSTSVMMPSVPCAPQQVVGVVNCSTGVMSVGWNSSAGGVNYTAAVWSGSGAQVYCNTSDTHCNVGQLDCGKVYSVAVLAARGTCQSPPSQLITVEQVPCVPTGVSVSRGCGTGSVGVSWSSTAGAHSYTALAVRSDGQSSQCTSAGTNCSIANLTCGQVYSVGVVASSNNNCSSQISQTVLLYTEPCTPAGVSALVNCSSSTASLLWALSPNAVHYTGTLRSSGDLKTCNVSAAGCQISGLLCGQHYNFTVSASDVSCSSTPSAPIQLDTAPCATQNVSTTLACGSNALTVSWSLAAASLSYVASAVWSGGTALSCSSQDTSCSMQGLQCGQRYNVTVTASNGNCSGPASPVTTVHTAPCVPQNVTGHAACGSGSLVASWTGALGASSYTATVSASGGVPQVCVTSNLSCVFSGLQCATLYSLSVASQNEICNSSSSPATTIRTGPCDPQNVTASLQCSSGAATVTWSASDGASGYTVLAQTDGGQTLAASCSTSSTSCQLTSLTCGKAFNITVLAGDATCNTTSKPSTAVVTAPCKPVNISVDQQCSSNSAVVRWGSSETALSYSVTALDSLGGNVTCSSVSSSCVLTGLSCGRKYNVTVVSRNSQCVSEVSSSVELSTAPCLPQNVSAALDCAANLLTVQWQGTSTTDLYTAVATSSSGQQASCNISSTTSCSISGLHCGQTYNISVVSSSSNCSTLQVSGGQVQSAPCKPVNISVDQQCSSNSAVVRWGSSETALSYSVTALDSLGGNVTCSSVSSSCVLTGLSCGRKYNVTVVSRNSQCVSEVSSSVELSTAPCNTTVLSFTGNCSSNSGKISWASAAGATVYNTRVMAGNVQVTSCSTADTSCVVSLGCGQSYSAVVVASSGICNSSDSPSFQFRSAPCLPQNVSAALDCAANLLAVQWQGTSTTDLYTAVATSSSGQQASCNISSTTSCSISGLHCGQTYNISVVSSSSNCSTLQVSGGQVQSAPCKPVNISVDQQCSSNSAVVRWGSSETALSYSVTALDSLGGNVTCSSVSSSCVLTGLSCSRKYNVTVVSRNSQCVSEVSSSVELSTAPCSPTHVSASLNCTSNSVSVWWDTVPGVSWYFVNAVGSGGYNSSCSSSGPQCSVTGLQCGQDYSVTVSAQNNGCSSPASQNITLSAAPCPSTNLQASLDCSSSSALISWTPGNGTQYSNVTIQTLQLPQLLFCGSNGSSCNISALPCGQSYTVTATGYRQSCSTPSIASVLLNTAPCVPQNVQSQLLTCQSGNLSVSWQPSAGALSYRAEAVTLPGHLLSCDSNSTSCVISALSCGQSYDVSVVGVGDGCNSSHSTATIARGAPCPPSSVSAVVHCTNNTAAVSWTSLGFVGSVYIATAVSSTGSITGAQCNSTGSCCALTGLQCGTQYNVTVTATKDNCTSLPSAAYSFTTAPCEPSLDGVSLDCGSGSAVVVWSGSGQADLYSVSAVDGQGDQLGCNSTQTQSCSVSGLRCGRTYAFSVTALRGQCTSAASNTLHTQTAACPAQAIQTTVGCPNSTATVSWSPGSGAASYTATLQSSDGNAYACNSTGASCDITHLPCGQTYSVTVSAKGQNCSGTNSTGSPVKTAPCVPQILSASVNCSRNTASVSWLSSPGALVYFVTANSSSGLSANCTSVNTSCDLLTLACGVAYTVTVMAKDNNCSSACSAPVQLQTVPCVPQNLVPLVDCATNGVSVSWSPSLGAHLYKVTLQDSNGLSGTCQSSGGQCNVTGLSCGRVYHVSLTASDNQCTSTPSTSTDFQSVPCAASSISAVLNCTTDTAVVAWGAGAGSQGYSVSAVASLGQITGCSSNNSSTSCTLSNLKCGAAYAVSVQTLGASCNRSSTMSGQLITEPCVPQNLSVQYDTVVGLLFWDFTPGADRFTALAKASQGPNDVCLNVTDTFCTLSNTECGQIYNITVTAYNSACNGTGTATSLPYSLQTEPCPPQNVRTELNCSTHNASVSWDASLVAVGYVVFLQGMNGDFLVFSTQQTSFSIPGLSCGTVYTTYVQALGQVYNSSYSESVNLLSAPCSPDSAGVAVQVDCSTDSALISWPFSAGADNYTAMVRGSGGHLTSCSTQDKHCNVTVQCGQTYNLTLTSTNQQCQIPSNTNTTFRSRPCAPTGLVVVPGSGCGSAAAVLSWSAADAEQYLLRGWSRDGHALFISTNKTTVNLNHLHCSQEYNFTITASTQQCNSTPSVPAQLQTGPCSAGNISAALDCSSSTAVVSWQPSNNTALYTATLQDSSGPPLSCVGVGSQCSISGLSCGKNYSVTVTVTNDQCNSTTVLPSGLQTGPCAPVNVSVLSYCANNSAVVVWDQSTGATSYHVYANSSNSHASCQSTTPTCTLTNLTCGSSYSVQVVAEGSCTSAPSLPVVLNTGPCQPQNLSVDVQCVNSTAVLSWAGQTGAVEYFATAQSTNSSTLYCQTTGTSCSLEGLQCGSEYNFSVVTSNGVCNSSASKPITGGGVPCPPATFRVVQSVLMGLGQLLRAYWSTVNCPDSRYLLEVSGSIQGSAQSLFQMTSYWTSRTFFETPVPCGSTYSASVRAQNSAGTSAPSAVLTGISVPCPPLSVTFTGSNASAVVSWNSSLYANVYHVYQVTGDSRVQLCNTTGLSCAVTNVNSNLIVVTAGNTAGESAGTSDVHVVSGGVRRRRDAKQTKLYELNGPNAKFTMATADSLWLEWNKVKGAEFYSMLIQEQSSSSKPVSMTVYGEASIISDLKPATTYCVSLSAGSESTEGPFSEPVCVRTAALS
ncbi:G surface protein, allelic form 156-like isoform X3 [Astyanax mexicanus]|uniref:G surface protein, allelic form 156-like isoform X3 n=1 Tax=Astyanax mexicanus TaxID=7994 RepID=UPI0020CB265C|nr:G surface protein, allelic form 156-like isoform X3 [Astyanax mexicanus]